MVLVHGTQPELSALLADPLREEGLELHFVDEARDLFGAAVRHGARAILIVEPVERFGSGAEPGAPDEPITQALRAAWVPSHPRIVVVTARAEDDPRLRELRRSGAPWVLVRPGVLVLHGDLGDVVGRSVLVPRGLEVPGRGLSTPAALAEAVGRACVDDEVVGRTLDIGIRGEDAWSEVVAELGGEPRVVPRALARVGAWMGRATLTGRTGGEHAGTTAPWTASW